MKSNLDIKQKAWLCFDTILGALVYLGAAILAFFTLAVCWDVASRAVFRVTVTWVLEFTEYALLYMTFLSAAWLLKKEGHVVTDIVLAVLAPKTRAILNSATSLTGAFVCMVLTWTGAEVSLDHLRRGLYQPTPIETPNFPLLIIIPLGSLLLSVQFLRRAARYIREARGQREDRTEYSAPAEERR